MAFYFGVLVLSDKRAITSKSFWFLLWIYTLTLAAMSLCTRELLIVLLQGHVISLVHNTRSVLLGTFCIKSYQGPWLEKPCRHHKEDRASRDTRVQMYYKKKKKTLLLFNRSVYVQETEWRWPIVTSYPGYADVSCYSFPRRKRLTSILHTPDILPYSQLGTLVTCNNFIGKESLS